jgi:putative ABC transport system ATP-binding protein
MNVITAENVSKSYHRGPNPVRVLENLHIEISAGESVAITGPSGSGKSTLLSLLCGLDDPDSGRVLVCGSELSTLDETQRSRFRAQNISMVFQRFHLIPSLTAKENVRLPLEILNIAHADQLAEESLSKSA